MTHHKHVEPIIGMVIGAVHWVMSILQHLQAHINLTELVLDSFASVFYGLLGAFGAWVFSKIKQKWFK